MMKRFAILSVIALCLAVVMPVASAQEKPDPHKDLINHGNLGLYFDLTRLSNTQLNMFGVGGRIGFNVHRHVVLEGEMAYDFEQSKTQSITSGGVTNTVRSNVRMLHFLFGPKIQTTGPVRFFALAFYAGGGVELNRRKWGIRAEAGDEMIWFNDGVHHSLRVAFGPQIRF